MRFGTTTLRPAIVVAFVAALSFAACESAGDGSQQAAGSVAPKWNYSGKFAILKSTDGHFEVQLLRLDSGTTLATIKGFAIPAELRDAPPGSKMTSSVPVAFNGNVRVLGMHRYDPSQNLPDIYIDDLDLFLAHVTEAQRMTISYQGQVATFDGFDRLDWR